MKRKNFKILAVLSLICILCSVILPISTYAFEVGPRKVSEDELYSEAYLRYEALSEEEKAEIGAIPAMYRTPINAEELNKIHKTRSSTESVPVSYVLTPADINGDSIKDINVYSYGNIPMQIKDQQSYGTCWAFTSINTLETNLAKKGFGNYNFSELHLDWFGTEGYYDEQLGFELIGDRAVHDGGNFFHFLQYEQNGWGVVLDTEMPYDTPDSTVRSNINQYANLYQRALLRPVEYPGMNKGNNTVLVRLEDGYYNYYLNDELRDYCRNLYKEHLVNYGALYASISSPQMIWSDGTPLFDSDGYIQHSSNPNAKVVLNGNRYTTPDHAITIIGYDDNYSKYNFPASCRPSSNGAYIAMNSWGSTLGVDNIFYISYEDYWVEDEIYGVTDSIIVDPLGIKVKNAPTKTEYYVGETFDPTGMEIVKVNTDLTETKITNYSYSTTPLEENDGYVVISYATNDFTFYTRQPVTVRPLFLDVRGDTWFFDSVRYVNEKGIITGYNSDYFGPFDNLTREQLVNILWRIEGKPSAASLQNKFSDVPDGEWYTDAIKWASTNEIVKGYGGTTLFGLRDKILRQDLAIMLKKYAEYKGKFVEPSGTLNNFADKNTVSNYAIEAVSWASENGIISGNANSDGTKTIAPLNNATRAEAAVMLTRFCKNVLNLS